jgi:hypothetical protein
MAFSAPLLPARILILIGFYVPSPSLIMRTKGQQNVKANGLNSLPIVEQPALSSLVAVKPWLKFTTLQL